MIKLSKRMIRYIDNAKMIDMFYGYEADKEYYYNQDDTYEFIQEETSTYINEITM